MNQENGVESTSKGGAPKGNKNAAKAKQFEGALRRALSKDDWKRLNLGMEKLADAVEQGERWALEMVRDSLDGKPKQAIVGGDDDDQPLRIDQIVRRIVDPRAA